MILTWSKNCVLAVMTVRAADNNKNPPAIVALTGLKFQIKDKKLIVPVFTLSKKKKNEIKVLEQLKSRFKRTITDFKNNYGLIAIDLSKQSKLKDPQ